MPLIHELKADVGKLKGDVGVLKADVGALRAPVGAPAEQAAANRAISSSSASLCVDAGTYADQASSSQGLLVTTQDGGGGAATLRRGWAPPGVRVTPWRVRPGPR